MWRLRIGAAALLLGMTVVSGCSPGEDELVDAAGVTRSEAESMSLYRQFELVGERQDRLHELLEEARAQISDEGWEWLYMGVIPALGPNVWSLPGMDYDNSYHLSGACAIYPEGAMGERRDLDPMIDYFESKGWEYELIDPYDYHEVEAYTGDGFIVNWRVQPNGQYSVDVTSVTYWGDSHGLLREVADRIPPDALRSLECAPGVYPMFPSWDDPPIYVPDLLNHDSGAGSHESE